jgi:two-component system phosphate regulon sensor histidine kinase PhoR
MKSDFVSSVSHELRTPLTNIKGFTDTILRDKAMTTDTRTEFLGIIRDETNRLASLIEDLLEISRIESGKVQVQLESLDISDIVKRTAESVGPQIIKNDLKLVCELHDSLPSPLGDVEKIQIVILNLLGNAIKFTSSEGTITLRAFSDDMYLVVQVEDTGMGIPPKDLARITDRFYRVHRPGTEIPGTGLGLSIVQELVNLHGGKLEVTSKVGEGSIFSVHLPLQRSAGGDDKTIHLETAQDA